MGRPQAAYETISRAGDVLDALRSEIGASAAGKETEDDFLRGVGAHLRRILSSTRQYLDDWYYLDTVEVRSFRKQVAALVDHVEKTLSTQYEERGKPEFR